MTIQFFDIEARKTYEQEVETYDLRVKDRMDNPGATEPWPNFPKQPEPMVDSRDEKQTPRGSNFATPIGGSYVGGGAADPRSRDDANLDGNSRQDVKGYETNWTCDDNAPSTPFKIKR